MTPVDGQNGNHAVETLEDSGPARSATEGVTSDLFVSQQSVVTRRMQRAKPELRQNRYVLIGAGAVVLAILIFVMVSMPRSPLRDATKQSAASRAPESALENTTGPSEKSLFPIIDSQRTAPQTQHDGFLNEGDLERTAKPKPSPNLPPPSATVAGSLGAIPPFGSQENWQAPAYQPQPARSAPPSVFDSTRLEREGMEKASLVYMRSATAQSSSDVARTPTFGVADANLALPVGTKLRARLESAVSSAVRTPVLAVIEYNYERDGEIVVPAGTKAVGRLQDADRSGYARLQFESLLMADGAVVPIQAVATDLQMKPIRGKVEGKHTGKNILVRSLSGIGQAGAMLFGRGSLDQPLSESDLMRERISDNIGEASDEQISRMSITQHVVITIPADTPINVVIEQAAKPPTSTQTSSSSAPDGNNRNTEELRQLLQLQKELHQTSESAN